MPVSPFLIRGGVFAVFDPVGGEPGRRLCAVARESLEEAIQSDPIDLRAAIARANAAVWAAIQEQGLRGGGCTLAALHLSATTATVGWVGDTRVLRVRGAAVRDLAPPHTLRNDMIRRGQIDEARVTQLPSNVIVRLMGVAEKVEVDIATDPVEAADMYVLASDGFYSAVGEGLPLSTIQAHSHDLPTCVEALLAEATASGGPDDLTVVVARAGGDGTLHTGAKST